MEAQCIECGEIQPVFSTLYGQPRCKGCTLKRRYAVGYTVRGGQYGSKRHQVWYVFDSEKHEPVLTGATRAQARKLHRALLAGEIER